MSGFERGAISRFQEGASMSFPQVIETAEYVSLSTFRRSGKEVKTPVWFAMYDGAAYIFSEGTAGKVKRLRNSPRSRIAPCTYNGTIVGEWVDSQGFIVTDKDEIAAAYRAFYQKYGWKVRIFDFFSKLGGKYPKRAMLKLVPSPK